MTSRDDDREDFKPFGKEYDRMFTRLNKYYQDVFLKDPHGREYMALRMRQLEQTMGADAYRAFYASVSTQKRNRSPALLRELPYGFPFVDSRDPAGKKCIEAAKRDDFDALRDEFRNVDVKKQFPDLCPRDASHRLLILPVFRRHVRMLAQPHNALAYLVNARKASQPIPAAPGAAARGRHPELRRGAGRGEGGREAARHPEQRPAAAVARRRVMYYGSHGSY